MRVNLRAIWLYASLGLLALITAAADSDAQQIAFTWDDLPAHSALPQGETRVEIGRKLVAAMKDAHLPPVYGFVNGVQTEREPLSTPVLKDWRDAGMLIGNHAWSHMNLNQNSLEAWQADVLKNEAVLKKYAGATDWHWLRFPYLAEGDTPEKRDAARKFLAEHGYKVAGVTMSFGDYMWNEPYARCVAKGDSAGIEQLERSYLDAADASIDFSRGMAKTLYGHDIPYVLLMHVGAFDARMLPRLLKLYKDRGFTFVSLLDAEKDPFYANDLSLSLPQSPDSLEGAMQARGLALPTRPKPSIDPASVCK